ncbi:B12-binding domain-containing radical SAM protein [Oceanibacterium hippocampi]|uniref:Radical SAM superfamily protein n=1 Tax=Oceanibacterium hippocampi TaxID=745714 RepID=A0A1Y5RXZ6_9PROT|nr:radical SAM protein [Oceanibacterium hippocampi]SLN27570.1 Radical SAM superfamily protein [Oceanibacterium hippocampi]
MSPRASDNSFCIDMIKPSHYDDDGYVIQWRRAWIPSNSLSCLYGITLDIMERGALGEDVEVALNAYDETNTVIPVDEIVRRHKAAGRGGIVCMVGVQSNQFPRALDLARRFRAEGLQVAIGGFHASGCLAMLPELPDDLKEALELGITLFAGEGEGGRLAAFYKDALAGRLEPIYNHMNDLPGIEEEPVPFLPEQMVRRYGGSIASFDAGRGCPFQCSFCTIINVQGRKSRFRDADDIERLIRANVDQGINRFFITDDNFARNRNWEAIFDRIGDLREALGKPFSIIIQVDTLCHKIPNFIAKAKRAGVARVFIGLENINPDNLMAANKRQNRITEYRLMLQEWRNHQIITYAGYILGFPADTPERIAHDIEVIKRELPIDVLEFFCLTPLPGSEDHKNLTLRSVPMDPDMNIYDLEHVTTGHSLMSKDEWQGIYNNAWDIYYSRDHIVTLMRRMIASGNKPERIWAHALQFHGSIKFEKVHPLQGGYFRRKIRTERRSTLPIESPLVFYPRRLVEILTTYVPFALYAADLWLLCQRIKREQRGQSYTDLALSPVEEADEESLEMFDHTDAAKAAVAKARSNRAASARAGEARANAATATAAE